MSKDFAEALAEFDVTTGYKPKPARKDDELKPVKRGPTHPIRVWVEVYQQAFGDRLSRRRDDPHEFTLTMNRCTAFETRTRKVIRRKFDAVTLEAETKDALADRIRDYCAAPNVRMLADRIKWNEPGFDDVPRDEVLTDELLDGTAGIYKAKDFLQETASVGGDEET